MFQTAVNRPWRASEQHLFRASGNRFTGCHFMILSDGSCQNGKVEEEGMRVVCYGETVWSILVKREEMNEDVVGSDSFSGCRRCFSYQNTEKDNRLETRLNPWKPSSGNVRLGSSLSTYLWLVLTCTRGDFSCTSHSALCVQVWNAWWIMDAWKSENIIMTELTV